MLIGGSENAGNHHGESAKIGGASAAFESNRRLPAELLPREFSEDGNLPLLV